MKCQILFSGKYNKKNVNLSSDELAQRVIKVTRQEFTHTSTLSTLTPQGSVASSNDDYKKQNVNMLLNIQNSGDGIHLQGCL